ncbi:MAG TPA: protein-disulfide reductase DsbD domain-containing protein, partial [Candidatus Paceibacterota bacterium]|nr:protein-disulfide reductase DsbD domain-containing protein [Candidatus Paceibacterota bacterium]
MRSILNFILAALFCLGTTAQAAYTQAKLLLPVTTAKPGDTVLAGVQLRMEPEWHTYWKNSGASGIPTSLTWTLPPGITNGEIQWPVPEKLPPDDLITYIYENEVVLLVPLKLAPDLKPGSYTLKAKAAWLECKGLCLPGSDTLEATLIVGSARIPSADAAEIKSWQSKLPLAADDLAVRAWWEKPEADQLRPLILEWSSKTDASEADFYPLGSDDFEVQGATERIAADAGKIRLRKLVKKFEGEWPKQLSGVLVQVSGNEKTGYDITVPIASEKPVEPGVQPSSVAPGVPSQSLWQMLLYAFIGGLILNIMPCVLPV